MLPDEMVKRFRVTDGDDFKLKRFDPGDTCGLALDKNGASELLQTGDETPIYPYIFGGVGVMAILILLVAGRRRRREED